MPVPRRDPERQRPLAEYVGDAWSEGRQRDEFAAVNRLAPAADVLQARLRQRDRLDQDVAAADNREHFAAIHPVDSEREKGPLHLPLGVTLRLCRRGSRPEQAPRQTQAERGRGTAAGSHGCPCRRQHVSVRSRRSLRLALPVAGTVRRLQRFLEHRSDTCTSMASDRTWPHCGAGIATSNTRAVPASTDYASIFWSAMTRSPDASRPRPPYRLREEIHVPVVLERKAEVPVLEVELPESGLAEGLRRLQERSGCPSSSARRRRPECPSSRAGAVLRRRCDRSSRRFRRHAVAPIRTFRSSCACNVSMAGKKTMSVVGVSWILPFGSWLQAATLSWKRTGRSVSFFNVSSALLVVADRKIWTGLTLNVAAGAAPA